MLKRALRCNKKVGVPLYLNVYDLTPINGYLYWIGLGVYHSAIEAHGVEYGFGAHNFSSSGIFEVEPRSCPGFQFRKRVKLGTIQLSSKDFKEFMAQIASEYSGNTYDLMVKNCNHFCNDVSIRLTGSSIPGWVNRLAKVGKVCSHFLPDNLVVNTLNVNSLKDTSAKNGDKRCKSRKRSCLRSGRKSCLWSADDPTTMTIKGRCRTGSSCFLHPLKGRVFPWNWKTTTLANPKFRQL